MLSGFSWSVVFPMSSVLQTVRRSQDPDNGMKVLDRVYRIEL